MQEDTRKYGAQYERYLDEFEPELRHNDGSYVMPQSYEEYEARMEYEASRRWPLRVGDTIVYLDGSEYFIGGLYTEYGNRSTLNVTREYLEYLASGVSEDAMDEGRSGYPTAMRLLPGEKRPKDRIEAMAMIAREAKKHKWLENKQKWGR